jgi:hypothetical protein
MGIAVDKGAADTSIITAAKTVLRGLQADQKKIEQDEFDKNDAAVEQLFVAKKYSEALNLARSSKLDKGRKEHWFDAVETKIKHSDEDINPQQEGEAYLKYIRRIGSGEDPRKIQDDIVRDRNLKTGTIKELTDRATAKLTHEVDSGLKESEKYLMKQLSPLSGEFIMSMPDAQVKLKKEQDARSSQAIQALNAWISEQQKRVIANKREPITGQEIYDYAKTLAVLPHYRMSFDEIVESSSPIQNVPVNSTQSAKSNTEKMINIVTSDGQNLDIPESKLEEARKLDPKLKVVK